MKELEAENTKLKRLYAELALENAAVKDVLSRKLRAPARAADRSGLVISGGCWIFRVSLYPWWACVSGWREGLCG